MKELTINRKVWLRGEGENNSWMLRPSDGKMCCLGIYLESFGVSKEVLKNALSPTSILKLAADGDEKYLDKLPTSTEWLTLSGGGVNSYACVQMMIVNDKKGLSEAEREERLAEAFADNDVHVTFVDGDE